KSPTISLRIARLRPGQSPDFHAFILGPIHAISRLHAESIIEGIDVAGRSIRTKLAGRVRIGLHALEQLRIAVLAAPHLPPAEEEALLSGETVDARRRLTVQRDPVRLERHRETREVADVLAE